MAKGDNDPDGIRIAGLDLKGARIRFEAGCQLDPITNIELPCDIDLPTFAARYAKTHPEHRVRGGLHSIALEVSREAREGEPFTFAATRDGSYGEEARTRSSQIQDSAFPVVCPPDPTEGCDPPPIHRKVEFAAGGALRTRASRARRRSSRPRATTQGGPERRARADRLHRHDRSRQLCTGLRVRRRQRDLYAMVRHARRGRREPRRRSK